MMSCTVSPMYVLAGGLARRFGRDKALAEVDGQPMLQQVVDALQSAFTEVTLVVDRPGRYDLPGLRQIVDEPAGVGPMGGLCAAMQDRLSQHGEGWLFVASCDLIRPQVSWVQRLKDARDASDAASVITYRSDRWEPLFAWYHTRLLSALERAITEKRLALQGFLEENEAVAVALPAGVSRIPQANTEEELRRALMD